MKRKDILPMVLATIGTLFLVAFVMLAFYGAVGAIVDIVRGNL